MQIENESRTLPADLEQLIERRVQERVDAYLAAKEAEKATRPKKMALIATKGTLDWAYPPLILATTAAAMGCSEGSVKTHLSRARDALQKQLEEFR